MSLDVMKKIESVVKGGARITGMRPIKSQSLSGYPENDKAISELSAMVWGDCDGQNIKKRPYGKGYVYWGMSVADVLKDMNISKDVEVVQGKESVVWTHRRSGDVDIYFIANQAKHPLNGIINFRVNGKIPELWDAEKGEMSESNRWKINNENTEVHIDFESLQSYFVVFRKPTSLTESSRQNSRKPKVIMSDISSPWSVKFIPSIDKPSFDVEMSSLYDWSQSNDKRIKYFSGTATYSNRINITQKEIKSAETIYLELGKVGGVVSIRVNGQDVVSMWKHPYKADITQFVKNGSNLLEIEVSNTLTNCIIGDEQYPADAKMSKNNNLIEFPEWLYTASQRPTQRKTFTTYSYYTKDSKLLPSGLIGKVHIIRELSTVK